jgi:hypothetical protein
MLNRAVISLTLLGLSLSDLTLGRMLWPERNNKAVVLNPRRFGQQNPGITVDIGAACPGQVCGPLSGQSINGLLAAADPCQQQNVGDAIISELRFLVNYVFPLTSRPDASRQFDATTQAKMVQLAVQYVQTERNSAPVCFAKLCPKDL